MSIVPSAVLMKLVTLAASMVEFALSELSPGPI
jgi:hypothetical protein